MRTQNKNSNKNIILSNYIISFKSHFYIDKKFHFEIENFCRELQEYLSTIKLRKLTTPRNFVKRLNISVEFRHFERQFIESFRQSVRESNILIHVFSQS